LQSVKKTAAKMGKRGRKPSERKGYFYEKEEKAIVDYINETNVEKKNQLFNTILYPALTKMIESIIRRYKLFVPDEEFEQNFSDTISYLLTKINHYKPEMYVYEEVSGGTTEPMTLMTIEDFVELKKSVDENSPKYVKVFYLFTPLDDDDDFPTDLDAVNNLLETAPETFKHPITVKFFKLELKHYKAYSYCGTVCRNYLRYKCMQYAKKRQKNTPYDDVFEEISNSQKFSTEEEDYSNIAIRLINHTADEIEKMVLEPEKNELTPDEIKVGQALITLMRNWERILPVNGSNKLRKSSVLYYLREETMMSTKMVRDNMKKYKTIYYLFKQKELE
jgi:hypothetical protein